MTTKNWKVLNFIEILEIDIKSIAWPDVFYIRHVKNVIKSDVQHEQGYGAVAATLLEGGMNW